MRTAKAFQISMYPNHIKQLKELSKKSGRSVSMIVRRALIAQHDEIKEED